MSYEAVLFDLDGTQTAGEMAPSSEVPMHTGIYRERDAGAIAHAHGPAATTLSVLGEPLLSIHYVLVAVGTRRRSGGRASDTHGTESHDGNRRTAGRRPVYGIEMVLPGSTECHGTERLRA